MRQSNLKKHLQRKRRSARSASRSSVDRSGWQTRLGHKYLYISVTVRNVVIKNKTVMLVRCFNWFLRPIWRSWILLAIHFDCSSIYREYRNNFDQKLQNKSEKLVKTFVSASHLSDEFVWVASYVCRKLFSSGFYRENLAFFPRWNPLLNSCSTEAKSEWTFFLGLGSNWFQLRASIDRPLNPSWICRKTCLFFQLGDRNQGHSYQYARAYLKKSCTKKKIYNE